LVSNIERLFKRTDSAENERRTGLINEHGSLNTKRFFALDSAVYAEGALSRKQKEMMGLVASMVLRCQECIAYHLKQCRELGFTTEEIVEAMGYSPDRKPRLGNWRGDGRGLQTGPSFKL
jgi:AhpD family alkylhydroperoxidase